MSRQNVYYPARLSGIIPLLGGIPFLVVGLCGLCAVGWQAWAFFGLFAAAGAFAIAVGCEMPFQRIAVDHRGLTRTFWFGTVVLQTPWNLIESWLAVPYDITPDLEAQVWDRLYAKGVPAIRPALLGGHGSFTGHAALFRLRDRRWPLVIQDYQGWQPSFAAFLADVGPISGAKSLPLRTCIVNDKDSGGVRRDLRHRGPNELRRRISAFLSILFLGGPGGCAALLCGR